MIDSVAPSRLWISRTRPNGASVLHSGCGSDLAERAQWLRRPQANNLGSVALAVPVRVSRCDARQCAQSWLAVVKHVELNCITGQAFEVVGPEGMRRWDRAEESVQSIELVTF